ncbi:MAG TPA: LuxR C-terminal-related transcriptional regulator [Acidimicrobiales bacterium]|nr:LuxR C-terminal-related transcriptional regulator [Acidimicrobiales bacterium]
MTSPPADLRTRTAIDTSSVGVLTIDTRSEAIISCNDAFAATVGRPVRDLQGCLIAEFLDEDVKSVAKAVIEGIRAGFIGSVDGNVGLESTGGSFRVHCWILGLGTDRPHSMAIAGVLPAAGTRSSEMKPSERSQPAKFDPLRYVLATLDDDWRIIHVAPGSAARLGLPEPGATTVMPRLLELVHPDDLATLDGFFARRSPVQAPGAFTVRLRDPDRKWLSASVTVSPLRGPADTEYGLVAEPVRAEEPRASDSERVARLEDQLARIRQVVQASDGEGIDRLMDRTGLTIRQREIVKRLLEGHRVDAIALDLSVSPSTVRNHLSAIFERFGVATQSELIELLREHSTGVSFPSGE